MQSTEIKKKHQEKKIDWKQCAYEHVPINVSPCISIYDFRGRPICKRSKIEYFFYAHLCTCGTYITAISAHSKQGGNSTMCLRAHAPWTEEGALFIEVALFLLKEKEAGSLHAPFTALRTSSAPHIHALCWRLRPCCSGKTRLPTVLPAD